MESSTSPTRLHIGKHGFNAITGEFTREGALLHLREVIQHLCLGKNLRQQSCARVCEKGTSQQCGRAIEPHTLKPPSLPSTETSTLSSVIFPSNPSLSVRIAMWMASSSSTSSLYLQKQYETSKESVRKTQQQHD